MHQIDIYGFADRETCSGCDGNCADSHCAPGAKQPTSRLIKEFEALVEEAKLDVSVAFYEATDENIARHSDVQRLLGMADLSPVIILDGKVLFLGGFSPEGLRDELIKRLANSV